MSLSLTSSSTSSSAPPSGTTIESSTGSGGGGGSPALYLYTFLSTLVLLVVISGAIVIRSITVRRRHRAALAAALANGTFRPDMIRRGDSEWAVPAMYGSMPRPEMYDIYVPLDGSEKDGGRHRTGREKVLNDFVPLSATLLGVQSTPATTTSVSAQPARRIHTSRFGRYFFPPPPSSPNVPTPPTTSAPAPTEADDTVIAPALSLAVLITMPDPGSKPALPGESAEPPYCELGVVSAPISSSVATNPGFGAN